MNVQCYADGNKQSEVFQRWLILKWYTICVPSCTALSEWSGESARRRQPNSILKRAAPVTRGRHEWSSCVQLQMQVCYKNWLLTPWSLNDSYRKHVEDWSCVTGKKAGKFWNKKAPLNTIALNILHCGFRRIRRLHHRVGVAIFIRTRKIEGSNHGQNTGFSRRVVSWFL